MATAVLIRFFSHTHNRNYDRTSSSRAGAGPLESSSSWDIANPPLCAGPSTDRLLRISNSPVIILFFLLPGSPSCSGGALLPNRGERDCQANVGGWESIEVGDMSITRKNYLQSLGRMGPYTQRRGLMDRVAKRLETCHLCIRVCV